VPECMSVFTFQLESGDAKVVAGSRKLHCDADAMPFQKRSACVLPGGRDRRGERREGESRR